MGKRFDIDENAWAILQKVKAIMRQEGISGPSHSNAIRWLWKKADVKCVICGGELSIEDIERGKMKVEKDEGWIEKGYVCSKCYEKIMKKGI